ncbi:MAG: hypothetical protein Q4G47_07355, partial [Lachnospiraceae bacterium]|nr:hypothetical protein [Lachnospiraceae bacterium]
MKRRNTPFMIACLLSIALVAGMGALLFSSVKVVDMDVTTEMSPLEDDGAATAEKTVVAEAESADDTAAPEAVSSEAGT